MVAAHGEELREAALAGCGIVRLLACHVDDDCAAAALVRVLPDWECLGALPIVAIYRKARPTLSRVNAFVRHLEQAFRPTAIGRRASSARAAAQAPRRYASAKRCSNAQTSGKPVSSCSCAMV